jgi:DNA helicase-2/ATP-dependent DNA helicase PcrA
VNLLAHLNPEQGKAVQTIDGPVLVLAGAGTGKTRVITFRMAHLLTQGARPDQLLAMTFTNKAAREMKSRVGKLVGKTAGAELTVGTFHAFCMTTLRKHGELVGLRDGFTICDASDQLSTVRGVMRELHVTDALARPGQIAAMMSLNKNKLLSATAALDAASDPVEELAAMVQQRYDEQLRRAALVDFDDLLLLTLKLLTEHDDLRQELSERFWWVMVDEYQDTNGPQYEIVRALASGHRNLCVVGDDDQSIYGWRGADISKILGFEQDFPGAVVVRLETNYRSTGHILDAANRVIAHNTKRHDKTLRSGLGPGHHPMIERLDDEIAEAEWIVRDLVRRVQTNQCRLGDIAILFRTGQQPRPLETALRAAQVPYILVGGNSFFDRKEVRDVLAYLRLLANQDDEQSWLRIVNRPPRGVGKTSVDRALQRAGTAGSSVPEAFEDAAVAGDLPAAAAEGIQELRQTLAHYGVSDPGRDLVQRVGSLLEAVSYKAEVERTCKDAAEASQRWNAVLEVLDMAENYVTRAKNPSLREFLERVALAANDDTTPEEGAERNMVTLMTLHAAKGLEFTEVYIPGVEEGIMPHRRSVEEDTIDEERRLMYVGITRAKRRLVLTLAGSRSQYGSRNDAMPSRFLFEMTGESPPAGWRPWGSGRPSPARGGGRGGKAGKRGKAAAGGAGKSSRKSAPRRGASKG